MAGAAALVPCKLHAAPRRGVPDRNPGARQGHTAHPGVCGASRRGDSGCLGQSRNMVGIDQLRTSVDLL